MGDTVACSGAQAARINAKGTLRDKIKERFITPYTQKIKAQITLDSVCFFSNAWQSVNCHRFKYTEKYSPKLLFKFNYANKK
ncbi:hypothetical protein N8W35_10300 [Enterobacter roggenkampii]|nr:hypothetical protein [Enterobacter roggenkampii]